MRQEPTRSVAPGIEGEIYGSPHGTEILCFGPYEGQFVFGWLQIGDNERIKMRRERTSSRLCEWFSLEAEPLPWSHREWMFI